MPLELTGERTLPHLADENYWFRRHEVAYTWLRGLLDTSRVVLEAGPGEGYGAAALRSDGHSVVAVELDVSAAVHAGRTYPDVLTVRGDLQRLPVADASCHAVVSLQVFEHLWDQPGFLRECARVLHPAGLLVLTTPNRLTFSPGKGPDERPLNPFHTREVTDPELAALVADAPFVVTQRLGVRHSPQLLAWQTETGHDIVAEQISGDPLGRGPGAGPRRHDGRLRGRPGAPRRPGPGPRGRSCLRRSAASASSCTATCRGCRTRHLAGRRGVALPGLGRLLPARRRGARPPRRPRAAATSSRSASRRCWRRSSTTPGASSRCGRGRRTGPSGPTARASTASGSLRQSRPPRRTRSSCSRAGGLQA